MKVLKLAGQSGEVLVEQAKKHGETIVQEAEGQTADLLEKTKQQAERLHAAARGSLREAADERDRILTEARERGGEIRALAESDARATPEEAQSASQRLWQTVQDQCTAMQAETKRLQELRDRMMEHLTCVRTELNSSLFIRPPEEGAALTPVLDATVGEVSDGADATANAWAEPAASSDSAQPDSALVVQDESDEGGSEARHQVRPTGPARLEQRDDQRVGRLYRRYVDAWTAKWERQTTAASYHLWSMSPARGTAVAYPNLDDGPTFRWSDRSGLFAPASQRPHARSALVVTVTPPRRSR